MDYNKKNAIVFLDYNDTFDDIFEGKGHVFIESAKRLINYFEGNVQFVVITSASGISERNSIKDNLRFTLGYIPFRNKFNYLIEGDNQTYSCITSKNKYISYTKFYECFKEGTKADGVETLLKIIDPFKQISTFILAGNSKLSDLPMFAADVGNRNKFFIYNGKKSLNSVNPVFNVNMHATNIAANMSCTFNGNQGYIKTSPNSYGLAKAFNAIVSYLNHLENNAEHQPE